MSEYSESDLKRIGERWLERIRQAEKREDNWRTHAKKAEAAFLVDSEGETEHGLPHFNILHSNVETIVPSIFNSSPKPDIRPRHNNPDRAAKVVSDILERAISAQVDDSALDEEVEGAAQDGFMAGRGVVRVKFDADEAQVPAAVDEFGELVFETVPINERVTYEVVSWRDYREGPAKRWSAVPWVCYRHEVSEEERERLEDPELAAKQKAQDRAVEEDKDCTVWEIWCKESRRVYFVVEDTGKVLSIVDDPLGLKGFFPQPAPIQPITATGKRTPVCPYAVYEHLAKELDTATKRINAIMKGLKVRGAFAGDAEIAELMSMAGDNEITPVPNVEGLMAMGGLEKAVMWWPVETAIAVLRELYAQRESTKQAIYEITGISDIIRGHGAASETATAQQIKTEWGALRIKKMQRQIERLVRGLFVLTAEIMSQHFSLGALQKAAGMEIPPEAANMLQKPLDHYRIDVESDSTIRADLSRARGEMAQFLEGTASFFATMAPVVQAAPTAAGPLAKMYAAFARQFNLGKSAEDALDEFVAMAEQAAQQPQQGGGDQAAQAEMQMKMEELQGKMQLEIQKLQLQAQNLGLDAQIKEAELALKRDELSLREAEGELNAAATVAEIEMEQRENRAVKIGD